MVQFNDEADPAEMPNQVLGVAHDEARRARANEPRQQLHDQVLSNGGGMTHDGTPPRLLADESKRRQAAGGGGGV